MARAGFGPGRGSGAHQLHQARVKEDKLDTEAREKIAQWLWCQEAGYSWSNDAVDNYETELAKEAYGDKADQILSLLKELGWIDPTEVVMPEEFGTPKAERLLAEWAKANGYRKVPGLKVLSDEELLEIVDTWMSGHNPLAAYRAIAQAQLDSIKKQIEEANLGNLGGDR